MTQMLRERDQWRNGGLRTGVAEKAGAAPEANVLALERFFSHADLTPAKSLKAQQRANTA